MSRQAALQALDQLWHHFPELRAGQWNCRHIGSDPNKAWSQHAWGAALDISHKDWGYSDHPDHQAWLDKVFAWLEEHEDALSIKLILWRTSGHWNHIHIDHWPTNVDDPPCDSGGLIYQESSTGDELTPGDHGPENGYIDGWLPGPEGSIMTYEEYVAGIVTGYAEHADWFREQLEKLQAKGAFGGSIQYWVDLLTDPHNPAWLGFYARTEMAVWAT